MVASTTSNGLGRTLLQMKDSPALQSHFLANTRFSLTYQSHPNESPVTKDNFECQQCGKQFGNQHILKLHTRIHASQSLLQGVPGAAATLTQNKGTLNFNITVDFSAEDNNGMALRERLSNILKSESLWENVSQSITNIKNQSLLEKQTASSSLSEPELNQPKAVGECTEVRKGTEEQNESSPPEIPSNKEEETASKTEPTQLVTSVRTQPITRGKKVVGLTKIRMEDCRRCDACSCIYMDERDYIKHMKNFHKHDIKKIPLGEREDLDFRPFRHKQDSKRQRQSAVSPQKKCRSCCKQCKCKGNHDTLQPMLPILRPVLGRQPNRLSTSDGELPSDIKDRWKQVVNQRLSESTVGEAAESDISHLLSQVEVKIKTEPTDVTLSTSLADETDYHFPQIKEEVLDTDMLEY